MPSASAISRAHTRLLAAELCGDSLGYADAFREVRTLIEAHPANRDYADRWIAQPLMSPVKMICAELDKLTNAPVTSVKLARIRILRSALKKENSK